MVDHAEQLGATLHSPRSCVGVFREKSGDRISSAGNSASASFDGHVTPRGGPSEYCSRSHPRTARFLEPDQAIARVGHRLAIQRIVK